MKLQINPTKTLSEYAFHCTAAEGMALHFKLNSRLYVLNDPDNPNLETSKISLIDYSRNKFTIKDENCQYFHSNGFGADLNMISRCTGIRRVTLESRSTKYTEKLKL